MQRQETQTLSCVVTYCSTCLSLTVSVSPWFGTVIHRKRIAACFNSRHTATTAISNYTNALVVLPTRRTRLSTVGDQAFPVAEVGCGTACQSRLHQQQRSTRSSSGRKPNFSFAVTIICCLLLILIHANILYNSVLLLHNSFYLVLIVMCPSSLWTQCHYSKPRLIIIIIIITRSSATAEKQHVSCSYLPKLTN